MSTTEAETKQITGVCTEIAQKPGNEWVEFHIDGGGKWPVRLSTKLEPLIKAGREVGQELATWTFREVESDKINEKSGKPFLNRYLAGVEVGGTATPGSGHATSTGVVAQTNANDDHHAPLIAGDKDRAITRMACLKAAAELYSGHDALAADETDPPLVVMKAAQRFETWVYRDLETPPF